MAEELQKPKPRKKQQIEPLDWSTMAQSPALKGMVSFLEVTPEEIRRQQGKNGDSRVGSDTHTGRDAHTGSDALTGSESHRVSGSQARGSDVFEGPSLYGGSGTDLADRLQTASDTHTRSESLTNHDTHTGSVSLTGVSATSGASTGRSRSDADEIHTGSPALHVVRSATRFIPLEAVSDVHTGSDTHTGNASHIDVGTYVAEDARGQQRSTSNANHGAASRQSSEASTVSESLIGGESLTGFVSHKGKARGQAIPDSDTLTGTQSKPTSYVGTEQYPRPLRRIAMVQGDVVWQNRKIRRCVLAQDAHSQGEDALFSAMWSAAKPEASDPFGSRTLRVGYAELAQKSRMHRTNVRINIIGLRAKLAIEILDEHDSRDVTPRLYRLFSYKEILERRRAAGLEFVIRKKSVVFVTETGDLVPLPGLPKIGARRAQRPSDQGRSKQANDMPTLEPTAEQLDLDVRQISEAMSQYWPVDEAAAHQLLRQCRSVRRDADIDEILFFVNEKLQIALTNKNIKNPTGLILATVPPCFEGVTFQDFRRRRNEGLRLAAEEQERKGQHERDLQIWLEKEMHTLRATAEDETQSDSAREKARRALKQYAG